VIIFAASSANYISNCRSRNELNQPVINYKLASITLPILMSFAIIGVEFNHFLTESIVCLILMMILFNSLKETIKKLK
jgi:hypothetical protein